MFDRVVTRTKERASGWGILWVALALLGLLILASLLFFSNNRQIRAEFIPVNLHSELRADYSADPRITPVPAVQLGLIWDTVRDREPNTTDLTAGICRGQWPLFRSGYELGQPARGVG